jgi:alkyl hydroperoxide reductase subunit AhpC
MPLRLGATAPDFTRKQQKARLSSTTGLGKNGRCCFRIQKDFTPVCTTELGYVAKLKSEFDKRNMKVIGLSVDSVDDHKRWSKDIEETQGAAPNYPMIGDPDLQVAKLYDMLPAETTGAASGRTAADNFTVRNVYIIGPDKKIKLIITYPMTTGRNFDEILRVIDSIQLTANHKVATPANWKDGDEVISCPAVSNDEAKTKYPEGWKTLKPYLRLVKQPK